MMQKILTHRWFYISIAVIVIIAILLMIHGVGKKNDTERITTTIEIGSVRELVSVSGIAEAEQTADLAFPTTGIVRDVLVKLGDKVESGDILVTLDARALYADRADAAAALNRAIADRDELLAGPTDSARDVTLETITTKKRTLDTTRVNEEQKITNAYRTLLSSGLTTYSDDEDEDAVPPTVSGTYSCNEEGTYILFAFSSSNSSGYSYRLSGIETGTFAASTEQAIALGKCGLRIQFDSTSKYSRTIWKIEIPNKKSSLYTTNQNAYSLAVTQAESAIKLAEQALNLAETTAVNQNAPARSEAIDRANAAVIQAEARRNRIDTTITDKTLRAPFAGTVTKIDILPGETVTSIPVVTLLANSKFEVTARIPEIDIGKLLVEQVVEMTFDARSDEVVIGDITFISPQETKVDGVSYYEAVIQFREIPAWIRSGLNADIEIIIYEQADSLRIPKRFVTKTTEGHEVLILNNETTVLTPIEIIFNGNDGHFAITGLNEGDVIIAP